MYDGSLTSSHCCYLAAFIQPLKTKISPSSKPAMLNLGRIGHSVQNGHFVRPIEPLPQKNIEDIFSSYK